MKVGEYFTEGVLIKLSESQKVYMMELAKRDRRQTSQYIRNLIDDDIKKNHEYLESIDKQ